jgi:hypothetical protein
MWAMVDAQAAVWDDCEEAVPARTVLLERLQETPPGPELATLLASIDRSTLDTEGLLRLTQARQRLIAHQETEFLSDLHAVARAVPDQGTQPGRRDLPGKYPWAEVEAACALRWTYGRAAVHMLLADEVIDRLPAVHTALAAGEIDMPKVYVLTDAVRPLDDELARGVIDKVIDRPASGPPVSCGPGCGGWCWPPTRMPRPPARSGAAPSGGSRSFVNDSHLANLAGYDLAPHRVAAIMERLDAIAKAAKAAGDPRRVDQIKADAYLDLLAGEGIAVGEPITKGSIDQSGGVESPGPLQPGRRRRVPAGPEDATAARAPWPTAPSEPALLTDSGEDPVRLPADPEPVVDLWAYVRPARATRTDRRVAAGRAGSAGRRRAAQPGTAMAGRVRPTTSGHRTRGHRHHPAGRRPARPRRGVVELQVPLTTLLGLSQLPGELGTWAPVVADIARQVAAQLHHGTWRWSAYDRFGELAYHSTTNQRPTTSRSPTTEQTATYEPPIESA